MPESFGERLGSILAILVLILIFTGMGLVFAPVLAPLLWLLVGLDLLMLGLVTGITVVNEIRQRYV